MFTHENVILLSFTYLTFLCILATLFLSKCKSFVVTNDLSAEEIV